MTKKIGADMPGRILIVDDDVTRRITLAARLSGAFYDIRIAGSDEEAFALMQQWKPGVILVSDQLSAPTVRDFLQRIRQDSRCSDTIIFVVTAAWAQTNRAELLSQGADDVIPRSEPDEVFHARLRSHERARAMVEALQLRGDGGDTPPMPGFSDATMDFTGRIPVTMVASDAGMAEAWKTAMSASRRIHHDIVTLDQITRTEELRDTQDDTPRLLVMGLQAGNESRVFRIIAELRSQRHPPETEVVLIAQDPSPRCVSQGYDIGASEVMTNGLDAEELNARLINLQRRLERRRCLRSALADGLRASVIDPLTGLYNRRFALPRLNQLAANAGKAAGSFAVCIADIDHFKAVNDRHGHLAGDTALQCLAGVLRDNLRPCDLLARLGGEEFLIMLPETGPNESLYIASQLCEIVRCSPVPLDTQRPPLNLTVSIGVTIGQLGQRSAEELLTDADSALYTAKRNGRDQVALHARTSYLSEISGEMRLSS